MLKRKNSLPQNFVKQGYIISDIESAKDFTKIDLTSKVIGEFAIKNYKQLLEKDINRVNPIYIEM